MMVFFLYGWCHGGYITMSRLSFCTVWLAAWISLAIWRRPRVYWYVYVSLDILISLLYQSELSLLLYPVFVHLYLELVFSGHSHEGMPMFRHCQCPVVHQLSSGLLSSSMCTHTHYTVINIYTHRHITQIASFVSMLSYHKLVPSLSTLSPHSWHSLLSLQLLLTLYPHP